MPRTEERVQRREAAVPRGPFSVVPLFAERAYGNVMRVLVPPVISDEELERGLDILDGALGEIATGD